MDQSQMKSVLEMCRGAFMERADYEMSRAIENILDENTDACAKRKITITLELKKTSNLVLLIMGVFLFAFILCMITIFCVKGSVPDTLIQCVMGAGGVEAISLAWIKSTKVKSGENDSPEESEEER